MSAHLTKIGCLIGRHRWMYLISITGDEVIRVCGRCYDPKIATSSPLSRSAHDLVGRCPILTTKSYAPRPRCSKRSPGNDLGHLACSAKHADPIALPFGFAQLTKSRRVVAP
jgi:hypothetical protein